MPDAALINDSKLRQMFGVSWGVPVVILAEKAARAMSRASVLLLTSLSRAKTLVMCPLVLLIK